MLHLDLKNLERKVWLRYYQDGLMDIFLGVMLLLMGSGHITMDRFGMTETGSIITMVILQVVAIAAWMAAKRFFTYPRIGQVKFGSKGKARQKKWIIVLVGSALVGLIAFVLAMASQSGGLGGLNTNVLLPVMYVVNMVVVFGALGWISDIPRFYLIGVLFALPLPLNIAFRELAEIRIGYTSFAIPGGLICLMGLVVLIRFLRKYPRLQGGY